MLVSFTVRTVRSTTETSTVGTRNDMPVSLPLVVGNTSPTALAAPVVLGMMLMEAARPPRQSFLDGPSTVFCVAVVAWIVVIKPVSMPNPSLIKTWTSGARQLVVQEALETMWCLCASYSPSLTPMTMVLTSPLPGAEMMTFLAPAVRWALAFSLSVKRPVDSMTMSTPSAFHGRVARSLTAPTHLILWPLTISTSGSSSDGLLFSVLTWCLNLPWTESYI